MRRSLLVHALGSGILLLGMGCAGSAPRADLPGGEGDFQKGRELFEKGRYLQAIEALDAFRNEHPGSDRIDDAIFLLGQAHQKAGEHLLAREEFDRLLRDFPQSDHREAAQFERAMSWFADSRGPSLDPTPTEEALAAFRLYLRLYPAGTHKEEAERLIGLCLDRLAIKAYQNGETYLQLKQPRAAVIYFEKSLEVMPASSRAGDAMIGLGRAHELRADTAAAQEAYRTLLDFATPERSSTQPRLESLRKEAVEALRRLGAPEGS